jgi:hypothetical protein
MNKLYLSLTALFLLNEFFKRRAVEKQRLLKQQRKRLKEKRRRMQLAIQESFTKKYVPLAPKELDPNLGFIVLFHANDEKSSNYWKICLASLRRFYPKSHVMLINDNSNPRFFDKSELLKRLDERTVYVESEFPGSGELLPLYYFHKLRPPFEYAVILHDSVFVQKFVDFPREEIMFLWDFDPVICDCKNEIYAQIDRLAHRDVLLKQYERKKDWRGCFGCMCVIKWSFLDSMVRMFDFFNVIPACKKRIQRSALERVFALACFMALGRRRVPVMVSSIHDCFDFGEINFGNFEKFGDVALLKLWSGR